ncbi:MAG: formate dehydrogenase accessory sulfurtransferase FdhD [Methanolinea sp.]|nr:formate dehydrogenase accessory sulfurtransferase FdhD [Methanolinea sp.]
MTVCTARGIQVREGRPFEIEDPVIREETFTLRLNGSVLARIVASGEQLRELGAGFVVSQGLAGTVRGVTVEGDEIAVEADCAHEARGEIVSTGARGFARDPPGVSSSLVLSVDEVYAITREIETETWRQTGAVHCSVLYAGGEIVARASDVGRHNTVDKVIGHAVLHGIDRSRCAIGCTGRQPRDMVAKAAHAGIPVIISRAASTEQGIRTAWDTGITLVCFSRKGRFTVYTHPARIRELSAIHFPHPFPGREGAGREGA